MNIEYKSIHDFNCTELERLFLSVEWSSGHFPEKLVVAMKNFNTVYSAWDGDKLVGMICAMDDGIMNAYVHYLLVDPEYHGKTIGRTLVDMIKQKYKEYMRIIVIAYDSEQHFYNACGFEKSNQSSPMFITTLWT
ncbi:MAG: GNAT family N-acetyltransferase [Ruminococcaceae bacterium]|nr:GNAT family N-acetyltransferase [Oscillospiraceae bacterium]